MTNDIFESADRIAEVLKARGVTVHGVSKSTNRDGGYSAYIDCGSRRYRVSDHSCNTDFRAASEIEVPPSADNAYFDRLDADIEAARAAAVEAKREADAKLAAFEAPFIARFKEAKDHRIAIVTEAYPHSAHNKTWRREILARWRAA